MCIKIVDRIIAATPAEEEQLITLYGADPEKISIIPPGVDLKRFEPIDSKVAKRRVGIPCGDANILFAGRIEPLKGIDTMLRAMALLAKTLPICLWKIAVWRLSVVIPWADDLGR